MRKNIVTSSIVLLLIASVAKLLSFLVRIYLARRLSLQAMGYYSLVNPTMLFLITLAQLGLPSALSKIIAQNKERKPVVKASLLLSGGFNLLLLLVSIALIPGYASIVLKDATLIPLLYAIIPFIVLVSCSGLLKGYLLGKEKHEIVGIAQIVEELFRVIFLLLVLNRGHTPLASAMIAIVSVSVAEVGSILTMSITLLRKKPLRYLQTLASIQTTKQQLLSLLSVGLPITASRIIYTITGFLEPLLLIQNVSVMARDTVLLAYTQMNAYLLPILTISSFAGQTISSFALPILSKYYHKNQMQQFRKTAWKILLFSLAIAFMSSLTIFLFAEPLLQAFYHLSAPAPLLKRLAWPFLLMGIQSPLTAIMHATENSRQAFYDSCCGCVVRLLVVSFCTFLFQDMVYPFAVTLAMMTTTLLHLWRFLRLLFN